jgi:hypothetical protein
MNRLTTPVLFITFARPEYARKAFDQIKKVKPQKLYFYSNKARVDKTDENIRNEEIRGYVKEIDWDCDLKTFFRDEYVDIYTSLWSAFDWVFDNEENAILLEEDCVASVAFFDYCEKLLPVYKDDIRIWLISGNNYIDEYNPNGYDYIFSRYPYQYGWATWRSRWNLIKRENIPWKEMKSYELYRQLFPQKKEAEYQIRSDEGLYDFVQKNPAWDFVMGFTAKNHGSFGIVPVENLVSNIGVTGAHNKGSNNKFHNKETSKKDSYVILNPPPFVVPDYKYDRFFFKKMYYPNIQLHNRILRKLKRIFKWFYN